MPNATQGFEPTEADDQEARPVQAAAEKLDVPDTPEEYEELADLAPVVVRESKEGYKTTEFWVSVVTSLAVVFNGVPLPESKEGYVVAFIAGLYAVARGLAKKGVPAVETEVGRVDPIA